MSDNFNVKKKAGTSIITVLIIAFGLFLVCGGRPPQPAFDDPAGGEEEFALNSDDGELADFLDDESGSGDDFGMDEDIFADNSESGSSDDLFASDDLGSGDSEDGSMDDILSLLDSEEGSGDDDGDLFAFDDSDFENSDDSPIEFASVDDLTSSASSSEEGEQFEGAMTNSAYEEMASEAERLNDILNNKTTEADSLKRVLESYDEKIAVLELEQSGVGQQYDIPQTPAYIEPPTSVPQETSNSYASTSESSSASYDDDYVAPRKPVSVAAGPSRKSSSKSSSGGSSASSKYNAALNDYNSGKYDEAARKFEEVLEKDASGKLSDNCQYWLGECYMAMRDYTRAILEYEKVFVYDDDENDDDAQFKIGLSFLESGNRKMARNELDSLLDFYSDSELARKARSYLQRL